MFLTELITEGYVKVADPPFHNYTRATYDHYSRSSKFLENRLQDIKTVLSEILFPLRDITGSIPFAPNDWVSPAPKILIITDRKDIGDLFSSSMERLTVDRTNKRPSSRSGAGHVKTTRLNLGERCMLDIVVAPNNLTPILSHVDELILDCFAVCTFVSNQSVKNMQQNLLTARQMRSRFKGVYYFVAPQVKNAHGYYSFDVSCPRCGYTLGVDMDQAGSTGECPICNKKVLIPDCLDYMADAMLLPNDVPIVQIQPTSEKHCRDLMLFMIDSTLNALQPPPEEERGFKHSTQILSDTEVRERMAKPENVVVDIGIDTGTAQEVTPSLPPTPTAAAPEPETESDEPDAFSELFGDVFDDVGTDSVMFDSEDGGEDEGGEGDDFDIDDFISRVKGGG
jgi:hypothetical protein